MKQMRWWGAAVLSLGLVTGAAQAGKLNYALDTKHSLVVEQKHMMHQVLFANILWRTVAPEKRKAVLLFMRKDVKARNCKVLKLAKDQFAYIKQPDGFVDVEVRDLQGVLLMVEHLPWKDCL